MSSTITHIRPPNNSLQFEAEIRALRQSVWLSLYLAHPLPFPGLVQILTRTLVEVDRLISDLDAA